MKKHFLIAVFTSLSVAASCLDTLSVCSPSGKICVKTWMEKTLHYRVYFNGMSLLEPSSIDLLLVNGKNFSSNNKIQSHSSKKVNEEIISPVPEKRKKIPDNYNLLSISFRQLYKIEFRVYDDGLAYRFLTLF